MSNIIHFYSTFELWFWFPNLDGSEWDIVQEKTRYIETINNNFETTSFTMKRLLTIEYWLWGVFFWQSPQNPYPIYPWKPTYLDVMRISHMENEKIFSTRNRDSAAIKYYIDIDIDIWYYTTRALTSCTEPETNVYIYILMDNVVNRWENAYLA